MKKRPSPQIDARGFSLIEMLVMCAILGIIVSVAWAKMGVLFPMYQLEGAARNLMGELAKTRGRAISEGRCFKVVIDTTAATYRKESKPGASSCGTTFGTADPKDPADRKIDSSGTITVARNQDPVFDTRGGVSTTSDITLTNAAGAQRIVKVKSTGRVSIE